MLKNSNYNYSTPFFRGLLVVTLVFIFGCVEGSNSGGRKSKKSTQNAETSSTNTTTNPPTFTNTVNYFQNGTVQSFAGFEIDVDFKDVFYLRGKEINDFIKFGNITTTQCLIANFPGNILKTIALAASPRSFFNFSSNSVEYYYSFTPADATTNKNICQTTGVISKASSLYPTSSMAYDFASLCPSCIESLLDSSPVSLISVGGQPVTNVKVSHLDFRIKTKNLSSTLIGTACTQTSECQDKGYDCCSLGQCVNDKSVKPNVDKTSSEFIQAEIDIAMDPSRIYNYPGLYFLCAVDTPQPPANPVPVEPSADAYRRFLELKYLYECSTPIEGEMSICTVEYDSASKNLVPFVTGGDDRSFNDIYAGKVGLPNHSIYEITHGGLTLFGNNTKYYPTKFGINGAVGSFNAGNDDLFNPITISLNSTPDKSAPDDKLTIRYKIDGSCTKINTSLGKCKKYYIQGANEGKVTDHYPGSNKFSLPYYADINRTVKVLVDGIQKLNGADFTIVDGDPDYILFSGGGLQVFDTQEVEIEFYVNISGSNNIFQKKSEALDRISEICSCNGQTCSLSPLYDDLTGSIVDYSCVYPQPDIPKPPLQVTFIMSSKTIPQLYYDETGAPQPFVNLDTPKQEGVKFEYTKSDLLKPNNLTQYVGFNEIYGSMNESPTAPVPPAEVKIEKGKTYDIFVDGGTYSTCFYCGSDYWSQITKLFPSNFSHNGGGYRPDKLVTDRSTPGTYRADDLIFGRACWVPATMIPWTHAEYSDRESQRRNRMAAQHFLFANGYQRDWYGFDYGSVIASFDGITWFSVGNSRRIKSTSNRLFVAVNSYFGDLTMESSFTITVSEASLTFGSGSLVTKDDDSDGAECRKQHICDTDADCVTRLGWEYTCESISGIKTDYPNIDVNAFELPDTKKDNITLVSILGGNMSGKRCVYRGRGAPCHVAYNSIDANLSYLGIETSASSSVNAGLHACAPNYYCQKLMVGSKVKKFNNKISRFGKSVKTQNSSSTVTESDLDTFGKGVRLIGRPLKYEGDEEIYSAAALSNLTKNGIQSICLPGKDPRFTTTYDSWVKQHDKAPPLIGQDKYIGDVVTGQGMSMNGDSANTRYLNSCPILDSDNNYYYKTKGSEGLDLFTDDGMNIHYIAANQTTTSNILKSFESNLFMNIELLKYFDATQVEQPNYQYNRCLRMPGSVCHTDQDCIANNMMSTYAKLVDTDDINLNGTTEMNKYEVFFWQENLVCGQATLKTDPKYDIKNNRCCREVGKEWTFAQKSGIIGSAPDSGYPTIELDKIYPIDQDLTEDKKRVSQVSTYIHLSKKDPTEYPYPTFPKTNSCGSSCYPSSALSKQFNTLQQAGSQTCCGGHWIRNFHDSNGGGHVWSANKHQSIPVTSFACFNWIQCSGANCPDEDFTCINDNVVEPEDGMCLVRNIQEEEAMPKIKALSRLELLGIPQIPIPTSNSLLKCNTDPDSQATLGTNMYFPNIFISKTTLAASENEISVSGDSDLGSSFSSYQAVSSVDATVFDDSIGIKMIFSPDKFSCCRHAGQLIDASEPGSLCCSGVKNGGRCVLPDYTNVSVYYNKYVSSVARDIEMEFDPISGYPKSVSNLVQVACEMKVCNSGRLAVGVGWHMLKVPGFDSSDYRTSRFVQSLNEVDGIGAIFDAGVKWNNNVYCYPSGGGGGGANSIPLGMQVITCP